MKVIRRIKQHSPFIVISAICIPVVMIEVVFGHGMPVNNSALGVVNTLGAVLWLLSLMYSMVVGIVEDGNYVTELNGARSNLVLSLLDSRGHMTTRQILAQVQVSGLEWPLAPGWTDETTIRRMREELESLVDLNMIVRQSDRTWCLTDEGREKAPERPFYEGSLTCDNADQKAA